MAADRSQPDRSLVGDASVAFETGLEFLTELHRRFLARPVEEPRTPLPRAPVGAGEIVLTGVPPDALQRFRVAAGARAMEPGEYLGRLVELLEALRRLADAGYQPEVAAVLTGLGLATVTA